MKRLDGASKSFQLVEDNDLYGSTKRESVGHFTARGVTYKFVSAQTCPDRLQRLLRQLGNAV